LTLTEWEERISLDDEIDKIYKLDEIFWRQRAEKLWMLKGDANIHFSISLLMVEDAKTLSLFYNLKKGRLEDRETSLPILFPATNLCLGLVRHVKFSLETDFGPRTSRCQIMTDLILLKNLGSKKSEM
jgi:hypothetical protein